jgi:hypothetical protein
MIFLVFSCTSTKYLVSYNGYPKAPDYKYKKNWVASAKKEIDLPKNYIDSLSEFKSKVDVFYIYPTVYYSGYNGNLWNSNTEDPSHYKMVSLLAIKNQASVFSGLTNVYAPLYRQLFYDGLVYHNTNELLNKIAFDPKLKNNFNTYKNEIYSSLYNSLQLFSYENNKLRSFAKESYDLAYNDVKRAFLKYLELENQDKKIILAAHSQGTLHAIRLLKEVILPNEKIKNKLILSYLVGMPVENNFKNFYPCENPDDMNCYMSWNTFGNNFNPYDNEVYGDVLATNPVTFTSDFSANQIMDHKGILIPSFFQLFKYQIFKLPINNLSLKKENSIIVKSDKGSLQVKKMNIPWIKIFEKESFHAGDYNFFWLNIRENLNYRLSNYFNE